METTGLLEGLRGVLAPSSTAELPALSEAERPLSGVATAAVSEVSLTRAQLLQSLLAQQAEAAPPEEEERDVSAGERAQRLLVALVLLVAVLGMLIAQHPYMALDIPLIAQPIKSPGARQLFVTIENMAAEDTIWVALEYGPSEADELDLVAEPILMHLFDRGARISVVSTRPEGVGVADSLLSSIISSSEQYTDTQYLGARYLPGNAAGVSQLLSSADPPPRLIVLLTAQPGPLRWWVEQVSARGSGSPLIVAGLSAALGPSASPYLDVNAEQLRWGCISGLNETAGYEARRGSPGKATERLGVLAVGQYTIAILTIIGAVIYAFSDPSRREK
jgi:hypothetical protein